MVLMIMWMSQDLRISERLISKRSILNDDFIRRCNRFYADGGDRMAGRGDFRRKKTKPDETLVREGKIHVRICGKENGLEEYEQVNFVRVISKKYNLLIMADYLPIIGEVEGSVFFRTVETEYRRENIKGYFMHKNNEFSLMLQQEQPMMEAVGGEADSDD